MGRAGLAQYTTAGANINKLYDRQHIAGLQVSMIYLILGYGLTVALQKRKKKVKEPIVLREIHLRTMGRHLSNGTTQCYLLPDRGGHPAFTPTGQVGTRFIDPVTWRGVGCWAAVERNKYFQF